MVSVGGNVWRSKNDTPSGRPRACLNGSILGSPWRAPVRSYWVRSVRTPRQSGARLWMQTYSKTWNQAFRLAGIRARKQSNNLLPLNDILEHTRSAELCRRFPSRIFDYLRQKSHKPNSVGAVELYEHLLIVVFPDFSFGTSFAWRGSASAE